MGLFNFSKDKQQKDAPTDKNEVASLSMTTLDGAIERSKGLAKEGSSSGLFLKNGKGDQEYFNNLIKLAPNPLDIENTGLSESLLLALVLKQLYVGGVLTLRDLASRLCLSGSIVQSLIDKAKSKSYVENYSTNNNGQMRFSLSSIGELKAEKELMKSGYLGAAPIPLKQYSEICKKQSSRNNNITLDALKTVFQDLTFSDELLEKVGPSLNSTKPILIYGDAGTGKSYFCQHLNLVFGDKILIPHAIEVNDEIIQVFDPETHKIIEENVSENILELATSFDSRWKLCQRPLIISGGELSKEMLEVKFDPSTKTYRAPLQLKANNGILLLDDLGRQKISPKELFNRWIIPLEEQRDFLSLQSGLHFEIPFELLLLFSTNLSPTDLVDEAFLRRLGYKIEFKPLSESLYKTVWDNVCESFDVSCSDEVFEYLLSNYHKKYSRYLLPCYPRDLICIVSDEIKFKQLPKELTKELLDFAWHSYFVK